LGPRQSSQSNTSCRLFLNTRQPQPLSFGKIFLDKFLWVFAQYHASHFKIFSNQAKRRIRFFKPRTPNLDIPSLITHAPQFR